MKLKLFHKLLLALFVATALVLVLITVIMRVTIGRGFQDFLQQQELSQVRDLTPQLVEWHDNYGGWEQLSDDPRLFHDMLATVLPRGTGGPPSRDPELRPEGRRPGARRPGGRRDGPRSGRPGPGGPDGRRPGPAGGPDALHQRVFLLDSEQNTLIGRPPETLSEDQISPISSGEELIGWLGVSAVGGEALPEEAAFIRLLRNNLFLGMGAGLLLAALLAWLLARHLSRPVSDVAGGIGRLASGDFSVALDARGSDEIARLAEDVNRLSKALSEHESARKRWMSDMAHELRTPLAIISGEIEAMLDGIRPLNQSQLSSLQSEVKQLSGLVDDLHNLSLTDSGALAYKMTRLDLAGLVQLECESFQSAVAHKDLTLVFDNEAGEAIILGDERRIRQLLHNLLQNSINYTDPGGRITVVLDVHIDALQLKISDTAPGATPAQCEKLFDRLYRIEGSRNRNSGGSGLGLSICHNIVQAHQGSIIAEPASEGGILITVTLPKES